MGGRDWGYLPPNLCRAIDPPLAEDLEEEAYWNNHWHWNENGNELLNVNLKRIGVSCLDEHLLLLFLLLLSHLDPPIFSFAFPFLLHSNSSLPSLTSICLKGQRYDVDDEAQDRDGWSLGWLFWLVDIFPFPSSPLRLRFALLQANIRSLSQTSIFIKIIICTAS